MPDVEDPSDLPPQPIARSDATDVPARATSESGAVDAGGGEQESGELLARLAPRVSLASRYGIESEVARGGMGVILKVWDRDLRRRLAMKVLLGAVSEASTKPDVGRADSRTLGRFLEEAQVTGQLDHPGIVPVHELGLDRDGRVFFTMRLVKGRELKKIIDLVHRGEEDWNQTRALGVLLKVCEAMSYAHSKGVIHRDLKPANVMVGNFGEVYVMDWGLARSLGRKDAHELRLREESHSVSIHTDRREEREREPDSPLITLDGDIVGTPSYMAPEQAQGRIEELGPRSDVYAVGAMLYHLLSGQAPYVSPGARMSPRTVLVLLLQGPPKALHEVRKDVPGELVAICEMAMAREPGARYADMGAMAADLRSYLENRVVAAYETGAIAEFKKWVARNRGLATASAVALLLGIFGLASIGYVQAQGRDAAEAQRKVAELNEKRALASEHVAREVTAKVLRLSDARRLADYVGELERLWPARPERVPAMEAWLAKADALASNLPLHRATLAELRSKSRSSTPSAADPEQRDWSFDSQEDQWQHDTLAQLVLGLERFIDEDPGVGAIANVRRRLDFARTIVRDSIEAHQPEWDRAEASIASMRECPRYGGLVIGPQIGLVPLGRDASSGLWEFAHLETGSIPARDPATHDLVITEESGLVFVLLPGGSFRMGAQRKSGSLPNFDPDAQDNEIPVLELTLAPFFMSKYEMTQGQWSRCMGSNPSFYQPGYTATGGRPNTLRHPVESVDWNACRSVVDRLGLVLPTEAEWEYAARGGTGTPWSSGEDRETLRGAANIADEAARRGLATWSDIDDWPGFEDGWAAHAPVGSFRPNPFGLHDVHGNVWEWCRDFYGGYELPTTGEDGERLATMTTVGGRINRGGGFSGAVIDTRSATRGWDAEAMLSNSLGLRPARVLE